MGYDLHEHEREAAEVRRVAIGTDRYVDSGSGWRKLIETTSGGSVRLTPGEAAYVEESFSDEKRGNVTGRAQTVALPVALPPRKEAD